MESAPPDFSRLQKLLALKRHEQPPPGHFDRLPGQIISRLKAERAGAAEPWWRTLLTSFQTKPAWSVAFSVLVLGALTFGVVGALRNQTAAEADAGGSPAPIAGLAGETAPAVGGLAAQIPPDPSVATNVNVSPAPPGLFSPSGQIDRVKFK